MVAIKMDVAITDLEKNLYSYKNDINIRVSLVLVPLTTLKKIKVE